MYYGEIPFKNWIVPLFVAMVDGSPKTLIDGNRIFYAGSRFKVPMSIQAFFEDILFIHIEYSIERWLKDGTLVCIAKEAEIEDDETEWIYDTPETAASCGLPVPSWQLGQ